MTVKKKEDEKTQEEIKQEAEKLAESVNSVGALIDGVRKADTREDVAQQTNNFISPAELAEFNAWKDLEKKKEEEKETKVTVSDAEFERRSKLDVSDPLYINPSLGHFKKGK